MQLITPEIRHYLNVLDKVDKTAVVEPKALCPFCRKEIEHVRVMQDTLGHVLEYTCDPCLKLAEGFARVACIKCRKVFAYIKPGVDEDGFRIKPDVIYHIERCPECDPDYFRNRTVRLVLLEKQFYMQQRGLTGHVSGAV